MSPRVKALSQTEIDGVRCADPTLSTIQPMSAARQSNGFTLLTPPGPAAIAVVRLSGPSVTAFLRQHMRFHTPRGAACAAEDRGVEPRGGVFRATLLDVEAAPLDDILVSIHSAAPSCEVRLHLHGSPGIVRRVAELARAAGLCAVSDTSLEQAGDIAALWPAADALEREAFALAPRMLTERGARWLLAQPARLRAAIDALRRAGPSDESRAACAAIARRRCMVDWFATPLRVAIVGPPNAGKSTLTNALAQHTVSIVSATPGTTRDWVEAPGEIDGFPVLWIDTAGLRHTHDELEAAGIARTRRVLAECDASVVVLDAAREGAELRRALCACYAELAPTVVALNKSDAASREELAAAAGELPAGWRKLVSAISAVTGAGLGELGERLVGATRWSDGLAETPERAAAAPAACTDRQVRYFTELAQSRQDDSFRVVLNSLLLDQCD